jgi:hypothetical protein
VGAFLLDFVLPGGLILSLLALLHCVVARKGTAWFLIIVLLGPFGGLFYLAALQRWIKFEPKGGRSETQATAARRCPSCQMSVGLLYDVDDGRQVLKLCSLCKAQLELRQSNFSLPPL